ncbi:major facilitator superfamily MFS_1 [Mycolicibacterium rhodesiae JS60]|nr:major facilitator superfamily MFS_1 [Mycolicibacterium rhodesiae JS60]
MAYGTLPDRIGYKPLIVAGCMLRTAGFGLLVFADSLPVVLVASATTGFAGALFNPAVGQLKITRWFAKRWGPGRSLVIGIAILAVSFVPLAFLPDDGRAGQVAAVVSLLVGAAVLAIGSAAVFPFEMDTVVSLASGRLVGTHYGFYNTIVGVGILVGDLATGTLMQTAAEIGMPELTWVALIAIGVLAAAALYRLDRAGRLQSQAPLSPVGPVP